MSIAEVLLSLLFMMVVGAVAGRLHLFNETARQNFAKFVFYIATTALVFQSLASMQISDLQKLPRFLIVNSILYMSAAAILYLILRLFRVRYAYGGAILFNGLAGNLIFIGLPVVNSLYGSEGVLYVIALLTVPIALFNIVVFSLLGRWRRGHSTTKEVLGELLHNPVALATVAGVIFLLTRLHLPEAIANGLHLFSATSTGLALFVMGLFLATTSWRYFNLRISAVTSVIKLFLIPLFVWLVGGWLGLSGVALAASVMLAAMPSAVFGMVIASQFKYDERATADSIMLSSVLILATSPLWIYVVHNSL